MSLYRSPHSRLGAFDVPHLAGDSKVDQCDGYPGRCAGYPECRLTVQFTGYGKRGGEYSCRDDTYWMERAEMKKNTQS